jgi:hypothetical protein
VLVRGLLDWTVFASDRRGDAEVSACAGSNRLQMTGKGVSLAAMVWPAGHDAGANRDRTEPASPTESRRFAGFEWERWILAILILGGTIAGAYWARRRLMTASAVGAATFENVLKLISSEGNQGIMLVGPPRMRKDRLVKDAVTAHARLKKPPDGPEPIYRITLDVTIDAAFLKTTLAEVSRRSKLPALLDAKKRLWIHVSNLETQLVTAERRAAVLELLEKLLERPDGQPCRVVVATTTIDPIAHFHEIFTKEREGIYDDDIPEVELSRSSLLLSRFRRCYLPIPTNRGRDPWWNYDPTTWQRTLDWEAAGYPRLWRLRTRSRRRFATASRHPQTCPAPNSRGRFEARRWPRTTSCGQAAHAARRSCWFSSLRRAS